MSSVSFTHVHESTVYITLCTLYLVSHPLQHRSSTRFAHVGDKTTYVRMQNNQTSPNAADGPWQDRCDKDRMRLVLIRWFKLLFSRSGIRYLGKQNSHINIFIEFSSKIEITVLLPLKQRFFFSALYAFSFRGIRQCSLYYYRSSAFYSQLHQRKLNHNHIFHLSGVWEGILFE